MSELKSKPKATSSLAEKEIDKLADQFEKFDSEVKSMTMDRMNMAPKEEVEQQTKLSQAEIHKDNSLYLKPIKTIGCRDKFNEKFRADYEYQKEYVNFTAENKEIIGETIDIWTRPFPGMPAEEWKVPCNKPLWGPRYLAEQLKRKVYHRLKMDESVVNSADGHGKYYGTMVVDTTVQRLDAIPVSSRKSVFMGAKSF